MSRQTIGLAAIIIAVLFALTLTGCGDSAGAVSKSDKRVLTVSAASSLKDAFEEIGQAFESKHPGVEVAFNFGSSGDLKQQIIGGAPVDVFASAGTKEMDELSQKGLILSDTLFEGIGNQLVLVAPAADPASLGAVGSLNGLQRDAVRRIAVGNPQTVPAGRYAEQSLSNSGLWDPLKDKFVIAENVRQVLDYVARGEVDAGIVYSTDARTRAGDVKVIFSIPEDSHQPIIYPMSVIREARDEALARDFLESVQSAAGLRAFAGRDFKLRE